MALSILQWMARLALGVLFAYAGHIKVREPFLFEMSVDSYQLFSPPVVILIARTLPWLEVVLGLLLIVGWQLRYAASFTVLLLGGFLVAMISAFARGVEANCGCFGSGEPISPATLARDAGLFLSAVFLAIYSWKNHRKQRAAAESSVA